MVYLRPCPQTGCMDPTGYTHNTVYIEPNGHVHNNGFTELNGHAYNEDLF
jgi:hypothetical protein